MALSTKIKTMSHNIRGIGYSVKLNPEFEKLPLKKMFVASFFISVATILLGLIAQIILPPEIPLFYGLPQTSEQLSPAIFIILPSLASILITIINAIISIKIDGNYLKRTLAFASIAVSILAVITTYKIIFLVGSL